VIDTINEHSKPFVGMLHELAGGDQVIVGRQVAVSQMVDAFGQHGHRFDYALFCPSRQVADMADWLGERRRIRVRDRVELATAAGEPPLAWHDMQLDMHAPFAIREGLRGAYPVTVSHHTLSYKRLLHDAFLRLLLADTRSYDAIVCTSTGARQATRRIVEDVADAFNNRYGTTLAYRGRYELVPLATDIERFRPSSQAAARASFDLPQDAFVLLWVGRMSIVDKADLLPLVDAFEELVRRNPTRRLMLVCAGTQRHDEQFGEIVTQYAARSSLAGAVRVLTDDAEYGARLPELYATADVFVSPVDNLQESFGITPIEAMACGIPQVVADWNGYRDTVVEGETGFLVPTTWAACDAELVEAALFTEEDFEHLALSQAVAVDMRRLVAAVQALIDDSALAEAMSRASRARAESHYGWAAVVTQLERLWTELAADAARERSVHPRPALDRDYATLRFSHVFAGHPTELLDDGHAFRLTDRGRGLFSDDASLPSHYNLQFRYLDLELLQRLLVAFARSEDTGEALTVVRMVSVLGGDDPSPLRRSRILRHLLWLLKYGYLRKSRES
jgi:glycosyltransferase involved in cell wall biosynthesis